MDNNAHRTKQIVMLSNKKVFQVYVNQYFTGQKNVGKTKHLWSTRISRPQDAIERLNIVMLGRIGMLLRQRLI